MAVDKPKSLQERYDEAADAFGFTADMRKGIRTQIIGQADVKAKGAFAELADKTNPVVMIKGQTDPYEVLGTVGTGDLTEYLVWRIKKTGDTFGADYKTVKKADITEGLDVKAAEPAKGPDKPVDAKANDAKLQEPTKAQISDLLNPDDKLDAVQAEASYLGLMQALKEMKDKDGLEKAFGAHPEWKPDFALVVKSALEDVASLRALITSRTKPQGKSADRIDALKKLCSQGNPDKLLQQLEFFLTRVTAYAKGTQAALEKQAGMWAQIAKDSESAPAPAKQP